MSRHPYHFEPTALTPPSRFVISIVMMLYCLVGIEILKQRHVFKSISKEYTTLDTIMSRNNFSPNHFNNAVAMTEVGVPSPPTPITRLHDRKETGSVSVSSSTSHPRPSVAAQSIPNRSPVSFRQYILMPLMFFVVLLAIWVAPTTNRIGAFINPRFQSYPLLLAVVSTGSLRGFWNAVVFIALGMKERKRQKRNRTWQS